LTWRNTGQYADTRTDFHVFDASRRALVTVTITLNGERFELNSPMTVAALLAQLDIDPRRVAVEHNLNIIKRQTYPEILIGEGDTVEIVNFVGGG
jgi:thiamine biosynthesis protein ThiS